MNMESNKHEDSEVREIPHVFGDYRNLMGVMTLPDADTRRDTAVIMVTAGMTHQVGPFRLHVEMARALSKENIPSFRFDLTGISASLAIGGRGGTLQRAASEIGHALSLIEDRYGIKKFFLFGLCEGADDSFFATQEDPRIRGAVMMDGGGYKTSRYTMHKLLGHFLRRAVNPQKWIDVVNRRFNRESDPSFSVPMGDDIREFPEQREAALQIQSLVHRDVRLRFIYSGGVPEDGNYECQYWNMFADPTVNEYVSTICFPAMNREMFLEEDRKAIVDDVLHWADANIDRPIIPQQPAVAAPIAPIVAAPSVAPEQQSNAGEC